MEKRNAAVVILASGALSLVISLAAAVAPAQAGERSIDYTLRWEQVDSYPDYLRGQSSDIYKLKHRQPLSAYQTGGSLDFTLLPEGLSWTTRLHFNRDQLLSGDGSHAFTENDYSLVSRQYQIGYSSHHQSVRLALEQFEPNNLQQPTDDYWALGLSTGGRLPLTGLWSGSPLWRLSLQGEYRHNQIEERHVENWINQGDWYIAPSVHWSASDTSLSAGIQMPLEILDNSTSDEPDYRIRADFKKRF